jgi:hypothetical protein
MTQSTDDDSPDGGAPADAGTADAGTADAGSTDTSGAADPSDAGTDPDADPSNPPGSCPDCDDGDSGAAARGGQDTNTAAAPDRSPCLPQGPIQQGTLAAARQLTSTESFLIQAGVMAVTVAVTTNPIFGPSGVMFIAAKNFANANGCTVALGIGGDVIGFGGGSCGSGVYWDPSGNVGAYGTLAIDAGFAAGLSAGIVLTIIKGGADAFGGDSYAVGGGGGEVVSGSGFFLYDSNGHFYGLSGSAGIGGGMPFGAFAQASHTWITPPTGN